MRKSKLLSKLAVLGLAVGFAIAQPFTVRAEETETGTETENETVLEAVDMSKGVTYIYSKGDEPVVQAINLNGNSVIIKSSPNSTDEQSFINIWGDLDQDGIVDEGETMYEVEGKTDLQILPIYGVYEQKSTASIAITLDGVDVTTVMAVYGGELHSTGEDAAVTFRSLTGAHAGLVQLVYQSKVTGDIDIDLGGESSMGTFRGSLSSEISGSMTVDMTGTARVNSGLYLLTVSYMTGSVSVNVGEKNYYSELEALHSSTIDGDLTINLNQNEGVSGNVYATTYGCYYVTVDDENVTKEYSVAGNVVCTVNGAKLGGIYLVNNASKVKKDVTLTVKDSQVANIYAVQNGGIIHGNLDMTVDGLKDNTYSYVYGVNYGGTLLGNFKLLCQNNNSENTGVYGSNSGVINGDVDIDVIGGEKSYSYIYGIYGGTYKGKADINIQNVTATSSVYGIDYTTSTQTPSTKEGEFDNVVTIKNVKGTSNYLYGIYGAQGLGSMKVDISNVEAYSLYGIYNYNYASPYDVDISIVNCKCGYFYGYENRINDMPEGEQTGDVNVKIHDVYSTNYIYGVYYVTVNGNVTVDYKNIIASCLYGAYGICANGNVNVTMENVNVDSIKDADGNSIIENYANAGSDRLYSLDYSNIMGDVTVNVKNVFGKAIVLAGGWSTTNILGNVKATLADSKFVTTGNYDTNYIFYEYNNEKYAKPCKGEFTITGTDFSQSPYSEIRVAGKKLRETTVTVSDDCVFPEKKLFSLGYSDNGPTVLTKGNDLYLGGSMVIDKDITADKIFFGDYTEINNGNSYNTYSAGGNVIVNEGVTVTGKNGILISTSGSVYNKGTIVGVIDTFESGYKGGTYIKGGTYSDSDYTSKLWVNYPAKLVYTAKAINPKTNGIWSNYYDTETTYGQVGNKITFEPTVKKGYVFDRITFKGESDKADNELALDENGKYSFEMPADPVVVTVVTHGQQIVLAKTVSDPCAVVGKEYTAQEPLYSLRDVAIANDGLEGEVTYAVDEDFSLPEGLILENGLIVGTPTTKYETGKKVLVYVTGKNDTQATLTLNVIVSDEQKTQNNQDNRIVVDEEAKTINLYGTPVVIDAAEVTEEATEAEDTAAEDTSEASVQTRVFLDENRDGKADSDTPLYIGDLSDYEIIGAYNMELTKPINITMLGGKVKSIYGALDSTISYSEGHGIVIDAQGGTAEQIHGLRNSSLTGWMMYKVADGICTSSRAPIYSSSTDKFTGYLADYSGNMTVYGDYTCYDSISGISLDVYNSVNAVFKKPVELTGNLSIENHANATFEAGVKTAKLMSAAYGKTVLQGDSKISYLYMPYSYADITVNEGAKLEVDEVYIGNSSVYVYQKGTLNCPQDKFSNQGRWVVIGDIAEGIDYSEWNGLFFAGEVTTNKKDTSGAIYSTYDTVTYENVRYVRGNSTATISYTTIPGYTAYVTSEGHEPVIGEAGQAIVPTDQKVLKATVDYIPDQIELTKQYADPVILAGTEYTVSEPVYDLYGVVVSNDTSDAYGTQKTFRVKTGASLPAGLSLLNGKVIGTVQEGEEGTYNTVFIVTGKNGTEAELSLDIVVKPSGTKLVDINDYITDATVKKVDLKGQSVVLLPDPSDSNLTSIYPDADHDGIADNNKALRIDGETSYNLSACDIFGYTDTETAYEGDISITNHGATLGRIYGAAYNTAYSTTDRAVVKGTVTINMDKGFLNYGLYGAYKADVATLNVNITGGRVKQLVSGAESSNIGTLYYTFSDKAQMYSTSNSSSYRQMMYFANASTITGNAYIRIGASEGYSFAQGASGWYGYSRCYGLYLSTVDGDVNCEINGDWQLRFENNIVNNTPVNGDININFKQGYFASTQGMETYRALVYGGSYSHTYKNINVVAGEEGQTSGVYYLAASCNVDNIRYSDVNESPNNSMSYMSSSYQVNLNNSLYAYTVNKVTIGGTYEIDEDITTGNFYTLVDSDVTLKEGITVRSNKASTIAGKFTNNGTLEMLYSGTVSADFVNNGTWKLTSSLVLNADACNNGVFEQSGSSYVNIGAGYKFINNEDATFTFARFYGNGTFVNYGEMKQIFRTTSMGSVVILTTTVPSMQYTLNNYSTMYHALTVDYPAYCFKDEDAKISITSINTSYYKTSGVEGDNNIYVKGNAEFDIAIEGTLVDGMEISSVVYGDAETLTTTSDNVTYVGKMPCAPTKATVNISVKEATDITLAKTEDNVSATVGVATTAYLPLYDLTTVEIIGDDDVENGYVAYSLATGETLPEGLVLKNGKIYGTPTKASDVAQSVKLRIRGKNQTIAIFTLTFDKIEKGVRTLPIPSTRKAFAGWKLSDVVISDHSYGTYQWKDGEILVGEAGTTASYDAYFIPNDTANYDWSKISEEEGTYEETESGVRIAIKIPVYVQKQIPTYTLPEEDITATYGDKLSSVVIPAAENGTFEWEEPDQDVGEAGESTFTATFIPTEEELYERVSGIKIVVKVGKKKATFKEGLTEVECAEEAQVLGDVIIDPIVTGKYMWYTDRQTEIEDGATYKLCFVPTDTKNYDWTDVPGWNRAFNGVVFEVKVSIKKAHVHNYGTAYKTSSAYHWYECECGDIIEKAVHEFGDYELTKAPTDTKTGVKTAVCKVCGYRKNVSVPALGMDISNSTYGIKVSGVVTKAYTGKAVTLTGLKLTRGTTVLKNGIDYTVTYANNVKIGTAKVTITGKGRYRGSITKSFAIKASKTKVYSVKQAKTGVVYKYKVTNNASNGTGTATLVGTTKTKKTKTYTSATVSATVKIGGVSFKVTAIGNNAFAGYIYLKKFTAGGYVKTIGTNAFGGCTSLQTVALGKYVTVIGSKAFMKCYKLTTINFPAKLTTIGNYAFYGCKILKKAALGAYVKSIGSYAFYGCKTITSIVIGNNVTKIGSAAFYGCSQLKSIKLGKRVKTIGSKAFYGVYKTATFSLPKTKYTAYKKAIVKASAPKTAVYKKY